MKLQLKVMSRITMERDILPISDQRPDWWEMLHCMNISRNLHVILIIEMLRTFLHSRHRR